MIFNDHGFIAGCREESDSGRAPEGVVGGVRNSHRAIESLNDACKGLSGGRIDVGTEQRFGVFPDALF